MNSQNKKWFVSNNRCLSHPILAMNNPLVCEWQFQKSVLLD